MYRIAASAAREAIISDIPAFPPGILYMNTGVSTSAVKTETANSRVFFRVKRQNTAAERNDTKYIAANSEYTNFLLVSSGSVT